MCDLTAALVKETATTVLKLHHNKKNRSHAIEYRNICVVWTLQANSCTLALFPFLTMLLLSAALKLHFPLIWPTQSFISVISRNA